MDTLKEMNELRTLYESGRSPWTLWQPRPADRA
jgi:hypothetical protein